MAPFQIIAINFASEDQFTHITGIKAKLDKALVSVREKVATLPQMFFKPFALKSFPLRPY